MNQLHHHVTLSRMPATLPRPTRRARPMVLRDVRDIRRYFATLARKYLYISASNFNMLEMHQWVKGWHNIALIDSFDAAHPRLLAVDDDKTWAFQGIEDVNHYLLSRPKVQDFVRRCAAGTGGNAQALFLFFDEALEAQCKRLGLDVALPPNRLVRWVDSKLVTTEIGNAAGVSSVPHVMARVASYAQLREHAKAAGLGESLVVQCAYGDSGKTTFFISSAAEYDAAATVIESQRAVKIMRRIRCMGTAIEACATRWGTVVGPLLTELIGQPSLTPYPGGWCGNENRQDAFTPEVRREVQRKTRAFGQALYQRGYRGTFELDFLIDLDSGDIYLGELNSRVTGVTTLTNTSAFSQREIPLFLFHLLEFDRHVDLQMDVEAFNLRMLQQGSDGCASQLILKHTRNDLQIITRAPESGVYTLGRDGSLVLRRPSVHRSDAAGPGEAFVLRIQRAGEMAYRGGDLAILFTNGAVGTDTAQLNATGHAWVRALQQAFDMRDLTAQERAELDAAYAPANVKSAGPV